VRICANWALLRDGLRLMLASQPEIHLLAADEPVPARLRPVVLVDPLIPDILAVCSALEASPERPRIILVGVEAAEDFGVQALRAGVRGIVGPAATLAELVKAIRVVHDGQVWAPKQVVARALDVLREGHPSASPAALTAREEEIVRHVAKGLRNREIAAMVAISEATVKAHLTEVFRKLGVRGRTQLAMRYQGGGATSGRLHVRRPSRA
jgi:DNA-binding NarL/FixJ family response regulator